MMALSGLPIEHRPPRCVRAHFEIKCLKDGRPTWRVTNPSAWDLARFVLPFLKGIIFEGDGQVSVLTISKRYGEHPLTVITVRPLV